MSTKIQVRRDTAAAWTAANPVLAAGEPAFETGTGKQKIGDGVTAWNALPYTGTGGGLGAVVLTGTPTAGQVPTASSGTAATWATPTAGGGQTIGAVVTAAGALPINKVTPVDATAGNVAMTLPAGQAAGILIGVRKHDATANTVTVTGNIAGVAAVTHTLQLSAEVVQYQADAAASWWVVGGNKSLSSLDGRYLTKSANLSDIPSATAARTNLGLSTVAASGAYSDLSGKPTATAGVRKRGYCIPAGSLAVWDAARAVSATQQRDVVCIGDSTTAGNLPVGNGAGWVPALRTLMVTAGVTDGGRGQLNLGFEDATVSGESFSGYVSKTGWAAAASGSAPGNSLGSSTVGDVLTLQYKAPSNAMRIRSSQSSAHGRLQVKVNGTSVGFLDPYQVQATINGVSVGTYGEMVKAFTGLTAGGAGQTVTITNVGGAQIPTPANFRTAGTATTGGAIAPGNYTYAVTFVDAAGGESLLSNTSNRTVPAGTSTNTVTTSLDDLAGTATGKVPTGLTKIRLYRATGTGVTNPASFQMVLETVTSGGTAVVMVDIGNTPGAAAPSVSTVGFSDPANGGPKSASISVEFYDSTEGITLHRCGYAGQRYANIFTPSNSTPATTLYDMQTALGLTTGLGANGMDWSAEPAAKPNARNPALAICAFGINDLNQFTSITTDIQNTINGVSQFIRMARSAGADPLIIIPHLEYATDAAHAPQLGLFRSAILNTADAHGVAWCDFSEAYGPYTAAKAAIYSGVHPTQTGYDTEAAYLWNNVLAATAAR